MLNSEVQRRQQAILVRDFIEQIQGIDPGADIVVVGDLNDFPFSAPVVTITDAGYTSLVKTLPVEERYGYVFDGNNQVLDHIVVDGAGAPAERREGDLRDIAALVLRTVLVDGAEPASGPIELTLPS